MFLRSEAPFEDSIKLAPNLFKVLLEKDRVRVLEFRGKAGAILVTAFVPVMRVLTLTSSKYPL